MLNRLKQKTTGVVKLNFLKLLVRSLLFIATLAVYLADKDLIIGNLYSFQNPGAVLLIVIWLFFITEMLFRFFPSRYESAGCQKQFGRNYVARGESVKPSHSSRTKNLKDVLVVSIVWIALNAGVGALYFTGVIDEGALLVISLFYAVCDIICILFYCPFQSLIMKNRCCVSCRIYNWDFLMMFTPMVFIRSYYTISLFVISLVLFIRWEIAYYHHPERFSVETNPGLDCVSCSEKTCVFKQPA
ncbi:MAG: hypothetical protein PHQ10_00790 [Dehalococcoidales bacterium]|nr:hypothetical protein [Dehalococcoidales bacterium]MDD4322148.1 hypothetical protein [Dehalococcoidales bacterium]MDD5122847.1 hypothetical protein [Dehalococcoidales bacterium]